MTDLDDKLFEILVGGPGNMALDTRQLARRRSQFNIDAIKQAFADAGYWSPSAKAYWGKHGNKIYFVNGKDPMQSADLTTLMTGQEWYDRFMKDYSVRADKLMLQPRKVAIEAAKRAAGIKPAKKVSGTSTIIFFE